MKDFSDVQRRVIERGVRVVPGFERGFVRNRLESVVDNPEGRWGRGIRIDGIEAMSLAAVGSLWLVPATFILLPTIFINAAVGLPTGIFFALLLVGIVLFLVNAWHLYTAQRYKRAFHDQRPESSCLDVQQWLSSNRTTLSP